MASICKRKKHWIIEGAETNLLVTWLGEGIKYNFLRIASRGIKTLLKGILYEKVASLFYSLAGTMDSQEGTNIICTSSSFVAAMTSKCATSWATLSRNSSACAQQNLIARSWLRNKTLCEVEVLFQKMSSERTRNVNQLILQPHKTDLPGGTSWFFYALRSVLMTIKNIDAYMCDIIRVYACVILCIYPI